MYLRQHITLCLRPPSLVDDSALQPILQAAQVLDMQTFSLHNTHACGFGLWRYLQANVEAATHMKHVICHSD